MPKIIIKNGPQGGPKVFVAAIKDMSSGEPYDQAIKLLKPDFGDTLVLFHINNTGAGLADAESVKMKKHFTDRLANDGLSGTSKFVTALQVPGVSVVANLAASF